MRCDILPQVRNDLSGKPLEDAPEDKSLPICWRGTHPFKSLHDVKKYFKPFALRFTKTKNTEMQLPPETYLIISVSIQLNLGFFAGFCFMNYVFNKVFSRNMAMFALGF